MVRTINSFWTINTYRLKEPAVKRQRRIRLLKSVSALIPTQSSERRMANYMMGDYAHGTGCAFYI
jgi:hypothetical protein